MIELRVRFTRTEEVKYISHLDIMKVFERAVRRAGIKISYSKGFNPHPQIVFGAPMGVGLIGLSEFADISLEEDLVPEEFAERLNSCLPKGFKIIEAKEKTSEGNIMSQIEAAAYKVILSDCGEETDIDEKIRNFLSKDVIMVFKENKRGKKQIDIKDMIMDLKAQFTEEKDKCIFSMLLKAGQNGNLKPELLINALNENEGMKMKIISTVRTALYTHISGKLTSPMDDRILLQPR